MERLHPEDEADRRRHRPRCGHVVRRALAGNTQPPQPSASKHDHVGTSRGGPRDDCKRPFSEETKPTWKLAVNLAPWQSASVGNASSSTDISGIDAGGIGCGVSARDGSGSRRCAAWNRPVPRPQPGASDDANCIGRARPVGADHGDAPSVTTGTATTRRDDEETDDAIVIIPDLSAEASTRCWSRSSAR